jgi:hypothetical protein
LTFLPRNLEEAGGPGLTLDNARNMRSVHVLKIFGSAEILGTGHGEPITRDTAAEIRRIAK